MRAMDLERAVEEWFSSRGFRPVEPEKLVFLPERPDMAFSGDEGTAFVIIARERAVADRGYFMEAVMRASALRPFANYLYLAVPKLLAPFVDTEVLREHGMGLLVVDEEGAREAMASSFRPAGAPVAQQGASALPSEFSALLNDLLARLSALEQRVGRLEGELARVRPSLARLREVGELREQVRALSARLDALSHRVSTLSLARPGQPVPATPAAGSRAGAQAGIAQAPPGAEELPSFFKDNPWLEVLARRGREDEVPA